MAHSQNRDYGWGILQLWINWLIGSSALTLLVVLSLWVKPLYMPFVAFGLQFVLFVLIRRNREQRLPSCYILPFIVSRVLFWSGVVMVAINLVYSGTLVDLMFNPEQINREIPFICMLIVAPISTIISGWGYKKRLKLSFCRDCRMRHGIHAERGLLGVIFSQVGHYQVELMLWLSAAMTIVGWGYYALLYVNSSLTVPDRFIFFWLPTLLWLAAAIYLALRYIGIWGYYCQNVAGSFSRYGTYTQLRFIIVWDNYIALLPPETETDKKIDLDDKFDSPVTCTISKVDKVETETARQYFDSRSGVHGYTDVRFMYANSHYNPDCNIFHYLCFLNDEQKAELDTKYPRVKWCSLSEVASLINNKETNPLFAAEIVRLHTVATTWKTYDAQGRRRYKIKHYRPTFQIRDIHKWDVDYNDPHWLYVADNNQDVPFYRCRKFWRKYINGIGQ